VAGADVTPDELLRLAQLCKRLHPRGHDEAVLIEQGVAWLELLATKDRRREGQ
jgi:hypothetical protein